MKLLSIIISMLLIIISVLSSGCNLYSAGPITKEQAAAARMIKASRGLLAPVYGPLAEQIVRDCQLENMEGIGIDLGSGPGSLIMELCQRTDDRMHWINADVNPCFFPYFLKMAEKNGFTGRISAIYADAQSLPFRDDYADILTSRGSYRFWQDKVKAFGEIWRILKPGGVAYIGRGFAEDFPVSTVARIRSRQKGGMNYNTKEKADELRKIMTELEISTYRIIIPQTGKAQGLNYGIWIEIRK